MEHGAAQVRPCGRLAFFHHYSQIRRRINEKLNAVRDQSRIDKIQDQHNFVVDSKKVTVFLVASAAGGTGSGMFLDMAFLTQKIFLESNISGEVTGILFLPSLFKGIPGGEPMQKKVFSNGFAALSELDYYSGARVYRENNPDREAGHTFTWDGEQTELISNRPFNTVYLVDNGNVRQKIITDYTQAFQMAAESIYLENTNSAFGDEKRSLRANLKPFLDDETKFDHLDSNNIIVFSEFFSNQYSSFGLSSIQFETDRKHNASAYFLGKSLAAFWRDSSMIPENGLSNEISAAFTQPTSLGGHTWDHLSVKEFFVVDRQNGFSLIEERKKAVAQSFRNFKEKVSTAFEGALAANQKIFQFYRTGLEQGVQEWVKDLEKTWTGYIQSAERDLGPDGSHAKEISMNADKFYRELKKSIYREFNNFICSPGKLEQNKGVKWAKEFIDESVLRLNRILSEFQPRALPNRTFPIDKLTLPEKDRKIEQFISFLKEAKGIRLDWFAAPAIQYHQEQVQTCLQAYLAQSREQVIKEIEILEKEMLKWYECKYENFVSDKAQIVLKDVLSELSHQIERRVEGKLIEETRGLHRQLDNYFQGLQQVEDEQISQFHAYNIDTSDGFHFQVDPTPDEAWYEREIGNHLRQNYADGAALGWEDLLNRQTTEFFGFMLDGLGPDWQTEPNQTIRESGFNYLFKAFSHEGSDWDKRKQLIKSLEKFCFNQLHNIFANTNADIRYQLVSDEQKNLKLTTLTEMAGVWTNLSGFGGEIEDNTPKVAFIGVPSIQNSPTADQAIAMTNVFGQQNNPAKYNHDTGSVVFYTEFAAMPLFALNKLSDYRKSYFDMLANDPNAIYERHLDFTQFENLHDILPPISAQRAYQQISMCSSLIVALMFNCLKPKRQSGRNPKDQLWFNPPQRGNQPLPPVVLGSNLNRLCQITPLWERYVQPLEQQISTQKKDLQNSGRNVPLESLALSQYYCEKVFPPLYRSGVIIAVQETNLRLIVKNIRRKIIQECVDHGFGSDSEDPKLWEAAEAMDLEAFSEEFPFKDPSAKAPLRVLKKV